jgi:hypothetical protein
VAGGAAFGGVGAALLSSVHPDSTTTRLAGEVPKETENPTYTVDEPSSAASPVGGKTSPPGAFPETPSQEPESFSVNPIPPSSGASNPISIPAGEKLPDHEAVTGNTVESQVTTSKKDYEKDASSALPEDKSYGVDPIPASAGIGNPVSVPAGESVKQQKSFLPGSLYANSTTSKGDYEKAGSAAMPIGAASDGAAGSKDSAFSVPEKTKDMIPESSLPMSGDANGTTDSGPFIQSSGAGATTAALAGQVPLEPKVKGTMMEDETPSATVTGPAPDVPEVVKESLSRAEQSPEAAASSEAVKEKKEVEDELLKQVKSTDAAGGPAPTAAPATSATAPSATATDTKTLGAGADPEAAAEKKPEPSRDISPMGKDPNATSPAATTSPTVTTGVGESKTSTENTPKKTSTPASSAASSPATATDGKDKKKRSWFGKLKEKLRG